MIGKKRDRGSLERLDRLQREIVRASALNEQEAETVAASPFLYARLRARINAERVKREEGEHALAFLGVVWRTVPAMALVAVFAFVLFWSTTSGTRSTLGLSDEALLGARDAGIERVVFADRQPLSSDEVLATILNGEEREAVR